MFEQLAGMLTHLGGKQIVVLSIGEYSLRFDLVATITMWAVTLVLVILALYLRRGLRQDIEEKPNRIQATLDLLIGLLREQLASNFASERLAKEMFPFISTLFLYVLLCNWVSMIPYVESPTANVNVTLGLALLVLVLSHVLAIRMKGVKKYIHGFIEPYPFMLPMNIVGELAKPISHGFRLFGNIFAGSVLIIVVTAKIAPVIVPPALNLFFTLLMGGIQAFVFAMLAVAYINVAVEN